MPQGEINTILKYNFSSFIEMYLLLYKFKVYSIMIWYVYILWNDYHNKGDYHIYYLIWRVKVVQSCSAFFMVKLSHLYMTTGKTIALTIKQSLLRPMSWSFFPKFSSKSFMFQVLHLSLSFILVSSVKVRSSFFLFLFFFACEYSVSMNHV